jgi:O-acetyl-ADP-ribose deacetylase (regulator of RNase III)
MTRNVLLEAALPGGQILRIVQGDLTEEQVDAIVNAANERLAHGGGVAGAIVRKGGRIIQDQSTAWVHEHGPVTTGTAAITAAGSLPAKNVIHAVGPVWRGGDAGEEDRLASAVQSALSIADKHKLASISLPGISSGIFGFPKPLCAKVMLQAVESYFADHPDSLVIEVNLVNIDSRTAEIFHAEAERQFGE